jgi:hypothetical protein
MFTVSVKSKEYDILTKAEADEKNIPYTHWSVAKPGDFALSDDGHIALCLSRKTYDGDDFCVFPTTRGFYKPRGKSKKINFIGNQTYWTISGDSWVEHESRRERTKRMVQLYVKMSMAGKLDLAVLGKVYRPDQAIPTATLRRLLKQDKIKRMISEEFDKILSEVGLTERWILEKIKKAMEIAEKKGNPFAMLKGTEQLSELRDMFPKTRKMDIPIALGVTPELVDAMQKAERELGVGNAEDKKKEVNASYEIVDPPTSEIVGGETEGNKP